jgi:hypothetical protein
MSHTNHSITYRSLLESLSTCCWCSCWPFWIFPALVVRCSGCSLSLKWLLPFVGFLVSLGLRQNPLLRQTATERKKAATGNSYCRGRLSTVDLHIKIGYVVVKKEKYSFSMKSNWYELIGKRRSAVHPLQRGFPGSNQPNQACQAYQLSAQYLAN